MAFDNHPHQLTLKRKSVQNRRDLPYIRDRRGKIIYRWDAYLSCLAAEDARKRDVWELAEYLDGRRKAEELVEEQLAHREKLRVDKLLARDENNVDPPSQDG